METVRLHRIKLHRGPVPHQNLRRWYLGGQLGSRPAICFASRLPSLRPVSPDPTQLFPAGHRLRFSVCSLPLQPGLAHLGRPNADGRPSRTWRAGKGWTFAVRFLPNVGSIKQHASGVQQDGISASCCCTVLCTSALPVISSAQHSGARLFGLAEWRCHRAHPFAHTRASPLFGTFECELHDAGGSTYSALG